MEGALEVVLVLLLAAHLLMVDVAMIGPLASAWLDARGRRRGDATADRAGLLLARLSTWGLTGGIVIGAPLLAMRWWQDDGAYFDAVAALPPSRLWFAGFELLFYFACMGAYTALWRRWQRWRFAHRLLAVAAATNLLMHFPALFIIISVIGQRADLLAGPLDSGEFRRLLVDGEVLSRVVHVWLAAVAVTGAVVMEVGLRLSADAASAPSATRLIRGGALVALVAALAQVPVGFWVTLEMPEPARAPLMGGDVVATGLFLASLGLALVLLQYLAAVALGDVGAKPIRRALAVLGLLVVLMVATRTRADRHARDMRRT
ncbi:MAG: hypothetical protein WD845_05495, partial [Pirellulales bacterium]